MRADFVLNRGDVVQINPDFKSRVFASCMMTITEVKDKRIMGFVQMTGQDNQPGGQAFLYVKHEDIEFVGISEWIPS